MQPEPACDRTNQFAESRNNRSRRRWIEPASQSQSGTREHGASCLPPNVRCAIKSLSDAGFCQRRERQGAAGRAGVTRGPGPLHMHVNHGPGPAEMVIVEEGGGGGLRRRTCMRRDTVSRGYATTWPVKAARTPAARLGRTPASVPPEYTT